MLLPGTQCSLPLALEARNGRPNPIPTPSHQPNIIIIIIIIIIIFVIIIKPKLCRYMASVIIGATSLEQLKENIDACARAKELVDAATEEAIDELHLKHGSPNLTD